MADPQPPAISHVAAFHEKPDLATAEEYLGSGRHLWNSGMFAWRAGVLLDELSRHLPDLAKGLGELGPCLGQADQDDTMQCVYPDLPAISIDHGVLEKSSRLRVVKADFGWSDVGSWEAMSELWELDHLGNACREGKQQIHAVDSHGNVVSAGAARRPVGSQGPGGGGHRRRGAGGPAQQVSGGGPLVGRAEGEGPGGISVSRKGTN